MTRRPPKGAIAKILRRWQWAYHKKWLRLTRHRYGVEERFGCLWLLDQKSAVDRSLIVRSYWEPEQLGHLSSLINKAKPSGTRSVFLDVGAHIGIYSILMQKSGNFDEVVAIEGEPSTAAQLGANLLLNDLIGVVRVIHAVASDKPGRVRFKSGPDTNRGMGRIAADGQDWAGKISEVDTVCLDDAVVLQGGLLAAKLDVEGAELAVLRGMEKILAANTCVLQIECFKGSEKQLYDWLVARGFHPAGVINEDHYFVKGVTL